MKVKTLLLLTTAAMMAAASVNAQDEQRHEVGAFYGIESASNILSVYSSMFSAAAGDQSSWWGPAGVEYYYHISPVVAVGGVAVFAGCEAENEKTKHKPWKQQTIEETGHGDQLCKDYWTGRLFRCDPKFVQEKLDEFNDERDEGMKLPFVDHEENLPIAFPYNDVYFTRIGVEPSLESYGYGYPANDDYYPHRRIPFEIECVKLEEMDELKKTKYGEDMYIISFPMEYAPMEGWQEV